MVAVTYMYNVFSIGYFTPLSVCGPGTGVRLVPEPGYVSRVAMKQIGLLYRPWASCGCPMN